MSELKTQLIKMGVRISEDNSLNCPDPYFSWSATGDLVLADDWFTIEQLDAIVAWIRLHKKDKPACSTS